MYTILYTLLFLSFAFIVCFVLVKASKDWGLYLNTAIGLGIILFKILSLNTEINPTIFFGLLGVMAINYGVYLNKVTLQKENFFFSSYLLCDYSLTIYKTELNLKRLDNFCYKFLVLSVGIYSFIVCHTKLIFFSFIVLALFAPGLILFFTLFFFAYGVFLSFLSRNKNWSKLLATVFDNKVSFSLNPKTEVWLYNLAIFFCFSSLIALIFNLNLESFSTCIFNIGVFLFFICTYHFSLGIISFSLVSNFCICFLIYLVYYSYLYSNKNWVFIFNSIHFLVYISFFMLLNFDEMCSHLDLTVWWLKVLTGAYFGVWLGCLFLSFRISLGSWEFLTPYFPKGISGDSLAVGATAVNSHKGYNFLACLKACHNAVIYQDERSMALTSYNLHYMQSIVHIFAFGAWLINNIIRLNGLFILLFLLNSNKEEILPFLLIFNGFSFAFLVGLHVLSYDSVWYSHFKKANGNSILVSIAWNMQRLAGQQLRTQISRTSDVLMGAAVGTAFGSLATVGGAALVYTANKNAEDENSSGPKLKNGVALYDQNILVGRSGLVRAQVEFNVNVTLPVSWEEIQKVLGAVVKNKPYNAPVKITMVGVRGPFYKEPAPIDETQPRDSQNTISPSFSEITSKSYPEVYYGDIPPKITYGEIASLVGQSEITSLVVQSAGPLLDVTFFEQPLFLQQILKSYQESTDTPSQDWSKKKNYLLSKPGGFVFKVFREVILNNKSINHKATQTPTGDLLKDTLSRAQVTGLIITVQPYTSLTTIEELNTVGANEKKTNTENLEPSSESDSEYEIGVD